MNECSFTETLINIYSRLSDKKNNNLRINEINKIKDYFNSEIKEMKIISEKLIKYIAAFDYIDKTLIVLSAESEIVSTISFTRVTGVPVGIASASFSFVFSLTPRMIKQLLKTTRNNKKRNIIKLLCYIRAN